MNDRDQIQFPLFWLEESKRNMEGLRDIIVHLEEKTSAMRYASTGYRGKANEMEEQIIATLSRLEGHISVLSDVVLATLRIVDAEHERRKHRVRRYWYSVLETTQKWERTVVGHWVYRILAVISTLTVLGFLIKLGKWILVHVHVHGR
jgi:hypothetical protein